MLVCCITYRLLLFYFIKVYYTMCNNNTMSKINYYCEVLIVFLSKLISFVYSQYVINSSLSIAKFHPIQLRK